MSIKYRLLISYIAAVMIPLILTIIAAVVIAGAVFDGNGSEKGFFGNYALEVPKAYVELENMSINHPDKLKDVSYLKGIDSTLVSVNTGIIIVNSEGDIIYASDILKDTGSIDKLLKNSTGQMNKPFMGKGNENSGFLTIINRDFKFSDKKSAKLYMISDFRSIGTFLGKYFSSLGLTVLVILLLTNVVLTILISTSITKPLRVLKYGAEQIKDGNLNFEVKVKSRDEIGDVCRAFEQMRYRLKESIDNQLQVEENRKELISSISHDLKTPVTSIKGYVEGIMDGVADSPEKMDKYIKTIYSKANDLDRLIDDLFLFSKLDLKKVPFNFEKVDLVGYFNDCMEDLRIDLEKRDVKLNLVNGCNSDIFVMADREKLKRVIVNIIENAVKYMDKEEKIINIDVSCNSDLAVVKIQDNGQGIKKEDLQSIFERFFRSDVSRNSNTGGSGLGLSIAKQIIEGHEGRIWAESDYGRETTISFTLKIVK